MSYFPFGQVAYFVIAFATLLNEFPVACCLVCCVLAVQGFDLVFHFSENKFISNKVRCLITFRWAGCCCCCCCVFANWYSMPSWDWLVAIIHVCNLFSAGVWNGVVVEWHAVKIAVIPNPGACSLNYYILVFGFFLFFFFYLFVFVSFLAAICSVAVHKHRLWSSITTWRLRSRMTRRSVSMDLKLPDVEGEWGQPAQSGVCPARDRLVKRNCLKLCIYNAFIYLFVVNGQCFSLW